MIEEIENRISSVCGNRKDFSQYHFMSMVLTDMIQISYTTHHWHHNWYKNAKLFAELADMFAV
jgi:hypothetical protein